MPTALQFTIGASATPFEAAMKQVEASARRAGTSSSASLQKHVNEVTKAMTSAQEAGQSTQFYAAALRTLQTQLAQVAAAEARVTAATNATARARAAVALGVAVPPEPRMVSREARKLRQTRAGGLDREVRFGVQRSIEETQAEMAMLDIEERKANQAAAIVQAGRDNRARKLRRERQERRAGAPILGADIDGELRAQARAEATAASISQAARDNRARQLRRQRAEERQDIAATATAEQRAASLASIGWIRMLRERRMERARERGEERLRRAEELEQTRQTTGLRGALRNLGSGIFNRFLGVGAIIGGVYSLGRFIVESVRADIAMQRIRNTLKTVSGSARQAASDFKFLVDESSRIGFSFLEAADGFARFAIAAKSAGLSGQQTRNIFTSVMEASATMGLSAERTGEAMLALEQMLSKGTVAAQELRLQLGNAMPAAVNTMAKALGITVAQLFTALESGSINSANAVQKFAEQLKKDFKLTEEANRTARDLVKVQNSWLQLKASVGEGLRDPLSNWLQGADEIARRYNLIAKLRETGVLSGMDQSSAFTTEAFSQELDSLMALEAKIANAEKKMAETREARRSKGPPRENEAIALIDSGDKESKLNDLFLRRIKIQELLADKTKVSTTTYERLRTALRGVLDQIAEANAENPIQKAQLQLAALQRKVQEQTIEVEVAERRATAPGLDKEAREKAVTARDTLRGSLKATKQEAQAKAQEVRALQGNAARETNEKRDEAVKKNDEAALTTDEKITKLKREQTALFQFINRDQKKATPAELAAARRELDELTKKINLNEKKMSPEKLEQARGQQSALSQFVNQKKLSPENLAQAKLDLENIHGEITSLESKLKPEKEKEVKETKRAGFSLGDLSQHRAGTFTGPGITMIDLTKEQINVSRQAVRELVAIKNQNQRRPLASNSGEY